MAFDPPKLIKTSSHSTTNLPGSTALTIVIPTGAKRSGGTCGFLSGHSHTLVPAEPNRTGYFASLVI
jgi:hypothetical protein